MAPTDGAPLALTNEMITCSKKTFMYGVSRRQILNLNERFWFFSLKIFSILEKYDFDRDFFFFKYDVEDVVLDTPETKKKKK